VLPWQLQAGKLAGQLHPLPLTTCIAAVSHAL
jgi:hypothetical protein